MSSKGRSVHFAGVSGPARGQHGRPSRTATTRASSRSSTSDRTRTVRPPRSTISTPADSPTGNRVTVLRVTGRNRGTTSVPSRRRQSYSRSTGNRRRCAKARTDSPLRRWTSSTARASVATHRVPGTQRGWSRQQDGGNSTAVGTWCTSSMEVHLAIPPGQWEGVVGCTLTPSCRTGRRSSSSRTEPARSPTPPDPPAPQGY